MDIHKILFLTVIWCLLSYFGFGQENGTLSYPETYVEVEVDAVTLQELSRDFSVDCVQKIGNQKLKTRICLSFNDFDNFLSKNIPYKTISQHRANVQMAQNYNQMIANWNRYPTYNTYLAMMDTFRTRYPQLCEIDTLLDNTMGNHKILCAHISNNLNDNEGKPSVLYTSTIHGDEVTGYYMMLRLIDYLLENYNSDTYVTYLINNLDIWICPLYNPDGTYFTSNNQINVSPVSVRHNLHWADLNRSFPDVYNFSKETDYEPEVEAMINFMSEHNFTLAANFHGGAEVFNYPWDAWMSWQHSHADADWWEYVGHRFADTCQYFNPNYMTEVDNGVTEGGDWYVISGSMQDWHNFYLGTRHVTIEVSKDKVLSFNRLSNYWSYIRNALLNFMAEADHGIHGVVTDSITGEPLQALVYISDHDLDHSYVETALPHGDYHRPIKAGQYAVTYSAEGYLPKTIVTNIADGQRLDQNVQLVQLVGIEDYDQNISVYPNPAKDILTVELSNGMDIKDMALFNMQGRVVGANNHSPLQKGIYILDINYLPAGTYFLHIHTIHNGEFIRKIVKH